MNHQRLAQICQLAKEQKTDSDKEVEFLYIEEEDCQIIAIRATEADAFFSGRGYIDVIRDLAIWPQKYGKIYGHFGFIAGWDAISDEVAELLKGKTHKPIYLTGHSLGGAIAMVGAYALLQGDYNLQGAVTFGAPRTLNLDGYNYQHQILLDIKTTQYQHARDPVPGFMKWTNYHHVDTTLLDGRRRKGWFSRRWRFHDLDLYERLVGKVL